MPVTVENSQSSFAFGCVKDVLDLQSQRSLLFKTMDDDFNDYLNKLLTDEHYKFKISQLSNRFAQISAQIIAIETDLSNSPSPYKAVATDLIRKLQEQEKQHLQTVVSYQINKGETIRGIRDFSDALALQKQQLGSIRQRINDTLEEMHIELAEM